MGKLASPVTKLSKQKTITATVIDVLGSLCSVRLSTRGKVLHGVKFIGPKPAAGDLVYVDYGTGTPVVKTSSENLEAAIAEVQRSLSASPTSTAIVPVGAPEQPLSSVEDWIITEEGAAITVVGPVEVRFPVGTLTDLGDGVVKVSTHSPADRVFMNQNFTI